MTASGLAPAEDAFDFERGEFPCERRVVEAVYVNVDGAPPYSVLAVDRNNSKPDFAVEVATPMIQSGSLANDASCSLSFAICHSFRVDLKRTVSDVAPSEEIKKFLAEIHGWAPDVGEVVSSPVPD